MTATEEFNKIIKVLKSCETKDQIKTTKRMFDNFKNKWKKNCTICFK
jgi:hypothetical protein